MAGTDTVLLTIRKVLLRYVLSFTVHSGSSSFPKVINRLHPAEIHLHRAQAFANITGKFYMVKYSVCLDIYCISACPSNDFMHGFDNQFVAKQYAVQAL